MDKTVLIIDDDDMLRKTLARGLRNEHFNVITAQSADFATDILSRVCVDAIILDRMMVGTDGLTFLHQIRQSGNTTPIIMLTAMTGPENTIDGLSGGADDYLAKPFQMRELILRLNNIMRNRTNTNTSKLPDGLMLIDGEFFVMTNAGAPTSLGLSGEEKKLLQNLTSPVGNIVPSTPMVAKRLRNKINVVLSNIDIITIRGRGYKLVQTSAANNKNGTEQ